jgi:hypothetical protein
MVEFAAVEWSSLRDADLCNSTAGKFTQSYTKKTQPPD